MTATVIPVPNGCRWCGVDFQEHCQRWHPDGAPGRWGCIADWHPVVWEITAHLHANGEPRVDDDDRMLTADAAERHGLALIAAARAARRAAAGSGAGED